MWHYLRSYKMYKIFYDSITGEVTSIQNDNMSIPICEDNTDFQEFLKWNAEQKTPLDYETPIAVEPQEPVETLEEKIAKEVAKQLKNK